MPSIKGGGLEKNFFIISNFLAKKINSVSIITVNKEFKYKLNKKIKVISPKNNFWKNKTPYIKYIVCLFLLIKTLFKSKNYLLFSFQANWYAILIAKIFNLKVISRSNTAPQGWSKNSIKNFLYKQLLNLADEIIVNSIDFRKTLKKRFNVNAKCIYNPLNKKEIIKYSKEKINFNFFNSKKHLKIINVGRFTDQKNQILILKSFELLKNKIPIKLLLIGRGENLKYFKLFIKNNKLKNYIKIINFLDNPYRYIKLADVFILSSNFEGLPNVLLEAQCLKKIIISSNCPTGPKEILLNGKAGLMFEMNDYRALAKKIKYVYFNKKKIDNKVQIGSKNLYRFSESKNLNQYLDLILKYI